MSFTVKLPDKPSELIDLALADAEALDREKYTPRADYWVGSYYDGDDTVHCGVCLAGAVMINRLGVEVEGELDFEFEPELFDNHTATRLIALDCLRRGAVGDALIRLPDAGFESVSQSLVAGRKWRESPPANCGFVGWDEFSVFAADMRRMRDDLAAIGL